MPSFQSLLKGSIGKSLIFKGRGRSVTFSIRFDGFESLSFSVHAELVLRDMLDVVRFCKASNTTSIGTSKPLQFT